MPSTPIAPITLADVPPRLRDGIERRIPRSRKFKDLTGNNYDRCVVLGFAGYKGPFAAWLCRCNCGTHFIRTGAALERGGRTGCGCFRNKSPIAEPLRRMWRSMLARCYDRHHESYRIYGKLGIRVCKRWRDSMEAFARDMGERPSRKHIVFRKHHRGDFAPANCNLGLSCDIPHGRARVITYNGKTLSLSGWAKERGIRPNAMRLRVNKCLERGWDVTWALVAPINPRVPMEAPPADMQNFGLPREFRIRRKR